MLEKTGLNSQDIAAIGTIIGTAIAAALIGLRGYLGKSRQGPPAEPPVTLSSHDAEMKQVIARIEERGQRIEAMIEGVRDDVADIRVDTQVIRDRGRG